MTLDTWHNYHQAHPDGYSYGHFCELYKNWSGRQRVMFNDYRGLRCLCSVAPVTKRSGKSWRVVRRRACQRRLVNALYHWSRVAVQHNPISKAKYKALRGRGHSHGRALRSVADRLLAIAV